MRPAFSVPLSAMLVLMACGEKPQPRYERPFAKPTVPASPFGTDAEIVTMLSEVSPARIEESIRKLVSFHTRHTLSDSVSTTSGIGAARRFIAADLESYAASSGGRLVVTLDEFEQPATARIPKPTTIVNVVATLTGDQPTSSKRVYVVSGHYDSRVTDVMDATSFAPGANDDASGTAAVMELARVMSTRHFDATLVFMAVAGEEQGLHGSAHWAEAAKTKGIDIAGMLDDDIIGSSVGEDGSRNGSTVRLFAEGVPPEKEQSEAMRTLLKTGGENDTGPRQLARMIEEVARRYVPTMKVKLVWRRDRFLRGGDHSPFLDRGFPAVRFTEPSEDFRHQHQDVTTKEGYRLGDLPEYVDFAYVAQVTRVNLAALANLALAPASPREVFVETKKLEHDTTLHWAANGEPDVASYRVVWRETTEPLWQHALDVGNVNHAIIKGVSKDDFIFGVEAVDQQGHVSPATYPMPEK